MLSATDSTVKIGTFEEVHKTGLVDLVEQENHKDASCEKASELISEDADDTKAEEEIVEDDKLQDLLRETGDFAVYKTYFSTVGFWPIFTFTMFVILHVGSSSLSR